MRSTILKSLVLGLTWFGLTVVPNVAPAQNLITLLNYNSNWRYFTNGTDLGTAWSAKTYNDAAWPSGPGLLGYETTPAAYSAPFGTTFTAYTPAIITYYFRAHFNFPTNPCGATLVASNFIDDGAVIYLNGTEVARFRLPANPIFTTVATAGPATEGQYDVITITPPPGLLVQGDNVVAVEVHQPNTTSSDIVWGMNLTATITPVAPVSIIVQPQDDIAAVGSTAAFCVEAAGGIPTYQWQRANAGGTFINLAGATAPCYTISPVQYSHASKYRVIVSNCATSEISSVAMLTVIPDVEPPRLVSAVASDTSTTPTIILALSEAITNATGTVSAPTNVMNYAVRSVPAGSSLIVSNAGFNGTNLVSLRTSPWSTDTNYVVVVNNLRDRSTNSNRIASNSVVGVAFWKNVLNITNSPWKLRDEFIMSAPAADWTSLNYVESPTEWYNAQAPFGFEFFSRSPLEFRTYLNYGSTTYYFRTLFELGSNVTASGVFKLSYLIDDGAIFYLNGREVFRYNMPAPPPVATYGTFASGSVDATAVLVTGEMIATNLVAGTNVLCVEVHQQVGDSQDENQTDVVFSAGLRTALAPDLRMTVTPNRNASKIITSSTLRWKLTGVTLESADNLTGPWATVANGTNGYAGFTTPVSGARKLYRLKLF